MPKHVVFVFIFGLLTSFLLLYLFPPTLTITVISIICSVLISAFFAFLAYKLSSGRFPKTTLLLLLLMQFYVFLMLAPKDSFDSRPADEVRAAFQSTFYYDSLPESRIYARTHPPFATQTAINHKFSDVVPEYLWTFSFKNSYDNQPQQYLLSVRNNIVGIGYSDMIQAQVEEDFLHIIVMQSGLEVAYDIPLSHQIDEMVVQGTPQGGILSDGYKMKLIPHYIQPVPEMRFQSLYLKILNILKG